MENPPSRVTQRWLEATEDIAQQDEPEEISFLHSILCQVGMPRRATEERVFERTSGKVKMRMEAGALFDGQDFVPQPLPYGPKPRLVMIHITTEAIRNRNPRVEVEDSAQKFLLKLGMSRSGGRNGGYTSFRKQMEALAACNLSLGFVNAQGAPVTRPAKPIRDFEAWLKPSAEGQRTMWPGVMELSQDFFTEIAKHSVPLDHTALGALQNSALALDIYTWLAHRLCRIEKPQKISWQNMMEQFGQEYNTSKDFKREFARQLQKVKGVYPDANIEDVPGGFILKSSQPPVPRKSILLPETSYFR